MTIINKRFQRPRLQQKIKNCKTKVGYYRKTTNFMNQALI